MVAVMEQLIEIAPRAELEDQFQYGAARAHADESHEVGVAQPREGLDLASVWGGVKEGGTCERARASAVTPVNLSSVTCA